jgi:hypothetical protein
MSSRVSLPYQKQFCRVPKTPRQLYAVRLVVLAVTLSPALWLASSAQAQVNVTTYHYDNARTGQNLNETLLTPTNVNVNQFGKIFSVPVDGYVYAQPLYLSSVNIAGGTHNVVFVATENDSLYAIDADSGATLWQVSLLPAGGTAVSSTDTGCTVLTPQTGITSTPVIDTVTGTVYVVTEAKVNNSYVHHLHAIDIITHAEKFGGPKLIQASVPGTGNGGTTVVFQDFYQFNRSGLLLQNGHVIIAWASHCDHQPYHGWVMSYSAGTLAQEAVWNDTPNGYQGGIWQGIAGDATFNTYVSTGNGLFDSNSDYGDTIVKLGPPTNSAFPLSSFFTPWNQSSLDTSDLDVGSGGVLLLPDLPAGAAHPHLLVLAAKEGKVYLVDRDSMGGFCSRCTSIDTNIVQELPGALSGLWGTAAYWNGNVYFFASGDEGFSDTGKAFSFNTNGSGLLSASPTSQTSVAFGFPGATPAVSANGNSNGIVWAIESDAYANNGPAVLHAYDASNLGTELYNSSQNLSRDNPGGAVKFSVPTVANGKVYVGTSS